MNSILKLTIIFALIISALSADEIELLSNREALIVSYERQKEIGAKMMFAGLFFQFLGIAMSANLQHRTLAITIPIIGSVSGLAGFCINTVAKNKLHNLYTMEDLKDTSNLPTDSLQEQESRAQKRARH